MPASKEEIIKEIKRLAEANGKRAPGIAKFERETGITKSNWYGIYWSRWGDAIVEAGYSPNAKQHKLSSDEVLRHFAEAIRHFGKIPSEGDLRMYGRERTEFPGHTTFNNHFGSKAGTIAALSEWVSSNEDYKDILPFLPIEANEHKSDGSPSEGLVYLMKSGAFYKIGRSDNVERRVKQITIALPEKVELVHSIRTDDPSGIETYWHRRFAEKRANGEWFKLTLSDVKAFKRRKYQ